MKKLLIILLLIPALNSIAQEKLSTTKGLLAFNQTTFQQSNQDNIMPAPYGGYRKRSCTNALTITGNVFAFIGGGLIGWPIGTLIGGGEPEWILAGIGAGCIAIGIPLAIMGAKQCNRMSMNMNESDIIYVKKTRPMHLEVAGIGNTVGLQLTF